MSNNSSKPRAFVFDIDGTLANGSHRQHWVKYKPKNWDAYNAAMHQDQPIFPVIELLQIVSASGYQIIICSGRQDKDRKVTLDWFERHKVPVDEVHMRPTGDYRDDTIIKEEMLEKLKQTYDIIAVFDDRVKVVDAWRKAGLYVFDCNQTREVF